MNIKEIRKQYPQYGDMSDQEVADGLHTKFYADMPRPEFYAKVGLAESPPAPADNRNILQRSTDYMGGLSDEIMNTATFGLTDTVKDFGGDLGTNIGNYIGGLINPDSKPQNLPQRSHDQRAEFREENPKMALTSSVVGGFLNPIANAKKVQAFLAGGKSLPSKIGRASVGGAGLSAAQAIGETDGSMSGRLSAGLNAAGTGAMVGPIFPAAVAGFGKLIRGGADNLARLSGPLQQKQAGRMLSKALADDGFNPKTALEELKKHPELTFGDLGENTKRLVYSVYSKPGEGANTIKKFLDQRQVGKETDLGSTGGQADRIHKWLESKFPSKYEGSQNDAVVNKLYSQAYRDNPSIRSDAIDKIARSHNGKNAFRKAVEMMDDSGEFVGKSDPGLTTLLREVEGYSTGVGVASGLKLKTWDYFKRALQREQKQLIAKGDSEGARIITKQIKTVTKELDNLDSTGGAYAKARSLSSDDFANKDALDAGEKFLFKNMRSSDIDEMLAGMSPAEQHHFRIGAVNTLTGKLEDIIEGANAANSQINKESLRRKVRAIFGDDEKFGEYMKMLRSEKQMFDTRSVTQGSQTGKNIESNKIGDANMILQGLNTAVQNPVLGGARMLSGVRNYLQRPEVVSGELSKALTSRDPALLNQVYQSAIRNRGIERALAQKLLQGGSAATGSLNSGEPVNIRMEVPVRSLANKLRHGR